MAKTKYEDRTRQQISSDLLKDEGLFGAIGTYLSGKAPRSESMDDPQGRSNRRRRGMETLKQREAEGKRRAAELRRKKEQELRKAKAARVLAQRKKEGEERAARLKKQKEEQIARRRAAPAVARAAGQATGEAAKQAAMVAATKPASKASAPKPKAPAGKTPASKTPVTKTPAPKAKTTKSTPAPTGDKKYNVGVSKGGVPFKEAFRFHRNKALKGGPKTFTWNGKQYTTELKKPVKKMGGGMMKSKMASKGGARGGRKAMRMKDGGFPDLTGDGKVTQADILKGRGVTKKKGGGMAKKGYANGGAVKKKGMAKGGAMKKKGYAMGGSIKKKGMAKGGAMTKKGMAKGGPVKKKGMSKGGVRRNTKPRGVGAALRGFGKALR